MFNVDLSRKRSKSRLLFCLATNSFVRLVDAYPSSRGHRFCDYSGKAMEEVTNTVVIGGGQAGLAMSRCLVQENVPHVVLEAKRIGERWRTSSWDSLRLLTPNWQSRLPGGWRYEGDDPDGFMKAAEFVMRLEKYAQSFDAPVRTQTKVVAVEKKNNTKGGLYGTAW